MDVNWRGRLLGKVGGILFDMDNTLLNSRIDYAKMKADTHRFLADLGVVPDELDLTVHTTGTLIAEAMSTGLMREDWIRDMWDLVTAHEVKGMQGADLEPGVRELLDALEDHLRLVVVTNNSQAAAREALVRNDVWHVFDGVIGRDQMPAIKPHPDGFLTAMARYPEIAREHWLAIGDSWIDGKAAADAGIRFVAYRSDPVALEQNGVTAMAELTDIRDLLHYL